MENETSLNFLNLLPKKNQRKSVQSAQSVV
jgi:hypothetical protein